ncbi:MAG: TlpA disulfide reductase family protein [Polyangiaceae bacterium]
MSTARNEPNADASGGILYPLAVSLLVVGLLLGFALLPRIFRQHESSPLAGKTIPDFTLPVIANGGGLPKDADGNVPKTTAVSALKGKVVILDFWATWCGPCNAEAPILDQVAKKYADRGLIVVGVSQDSDPITPTRWTKAKGVSYPMMFDDQRTADRFGIDGLPTMIVLDRDGVVRAVRVGVTQKSELEDLAEKYL